MRILTFTASSPRRAVARAKSLGRAAEFAFPIVGGRKGRFECIGILQLMDLSMAEPNEVWWEIGTKVRPSERRKQLIPPEDRLWVFTDHPRPARSRKGGRAA